MIINQIGLNVKFTHYIMLKLINDSCSSNADYHDARLSVKLICLRFEMLIVMELEMSFFYYTTGCTYLHTYIYIYIYHRIYM